MNMPKITEIHGRFKITKTTLSSLDLMKDIKIFAHYPMALTIEDNYSLKDVSDLLYMAKNITRPKAFEERFKNRTQILLLNNGRICHNDETREALQALVPPEHPIEFSDHCRKRCVGGVVDDATLKHKDNIGCQVILGSLTIQNFNFNSSADLKYFNTIEDIEGSLTIINSTGFKDLTFFKSLKGITDFSTTRPLVRIAHNPDLTSITPLHNQVELLYDVEDVDTVAVIKTYSAIDAMERKELEKQGRVIFHVHVKERKRPPTGNGRKGQDKTWTDGKGKRESEADDSDNLKEGIAVVVGGSLCFIVFGYGYAFIVYQRDRRRLERQQQLRNQNANDDIDAVRSKAGIRSSTDSRSSEKGSSRHRKRK
ncbi:hypothetical protein GCK32_014165 [Trichostrongylus colubriformis]|uniref:Receptor L-domain domain-containing protein n=1 Tax=Trichostrongylus colubriformis TaxID=6319 RepID=A0AAN8EZK4_TRICO